MTTTNIKVFKKGYESFSFSADTPAMLGSAIVGQLNQSESERQPGNWAILFQVRRAENGSFDLRGCVISNKSLPAFNTFITEAKKEKP